MEEVSLAEAKEHLEDLIARAQRGEEVRIVDPHLGVVRLTTVASKTKELLRRPRVPGSLHGKLPPPPDGFFDPMTEEELKDWYGDD
jgi:prevent-host-death family protein